MSDWQLIISEYIFQDLWSYIALSKDREVGGLGHVERVGPTNKLILYKLVLLPRRTGPGWVDPAVEEYARYVSSIPDSEVTTLRFYWHSHPIGSSGPYPSPQDEASIADLTMGHGWLVWMILTPEGQEQAALEIASTDGNRWRIPLSVVVKPRQVEIFTELNKKIMEPATMYARCRSSTLLRKGGGRIW